MAAKLIEVSTQRLIDNITSITPGALKAGFKASSPIRFAMKSSSADPMACPASIACSGSRRDKSAMMRTCFGNAAASRRVFSVDITHDARVIAAGSSLDGHGHVHVYQMDPAAKIPDPIQAILNKPLQARSAEETASRISILSKA